MLGQRTRWTMYPQCASSVCVSHCRQAIRSANRADAERSGLLMAFLRQKKYQKNATKMICPVRIQRNRFSGERFSSTVQSILDCFLTGRNFRKQHGFEDFTQIIRNHFEWMRRGAVHIGREFCSTNFVDQTERKSD